MLALANQSQSLDFNLGELFQLANALIHATGFVPSHIKHPGSIVAAILTGRELGIPPMAALRGISFVDGKPVLDHTLHLGVMIARGVDFRWVSDGSDGTAQLWLQRPGREPFVSVFTLEMAKKAGLTSKSNWQKYPAAMLRARAVSAASRAYMPDALSGCFVPGELEADREERPVSESLHAVDLSQAGQGGAPATVQVLPAQSSATAPLELPERIVRDLYAIDSAETLRKLEDEVRASWSRFSADERAAINGAGKWARANVVERERERIAREAEDAAAEAALAAKVDAALAGQGGPLDDGDDRSGQTGNPADATEPGASDAPDFEAEHKPDVGTTATGAEVAP